MTLGLKLPDDYKPSDGELDNLCYLTMRYTANWSMRVVDKTVCLMMAGDIVGPTGIDKLIEIVCDYTHDHIMGEPEEVTPEQLFEHMKPCLAHWYDSTTPEERSNTN